MAGLLHRGLVEEGYAVDVATNGTDGYAAAVSYAYDAVSAYDLTSRGRYGLTCRGQAGLIMPCAGLVLQSW
jgi:DNA-binding response OmpR family regulator